MNFYNSPNKIKKWAKDLNKHVSKKICQRLITHEVILNIISHYRNAKTAVRYHFTHTGMALIERAENQRWQGHGENGTLIHCWWE